jgi:Flp pilus assembly protein TadG
MRSKALTRLAHDARGVAAVELALVAPIFMLIMATTVDFGAALYNRFNLNGAVSAAANYAMANNAQATSSAGPALATTLAAIVASGHAANWADAAIVINNGPSVSIVRGASSAGGTAANADAAWCPTMNGGAIAWGAATTLGAACADGTTAGKFVTISASIPYRPMVLPAVLLPTAITASATVQVL